MPNNEGPMLLEYLWWLSCLMLCVTTVSLSSPELGCSCASSLCCREGSDQQVDYCVPFPLFPNWHCFSSTWSWQADLSALGKEWGRETLVLAEEGSFSWQAGKDPARQLLLQLLLWGGILEMGWDSLERSDHVGLRRLLRAEEETSLFTTSTSHPSPCLSRNYEILWSQNTFMF